MPPELLEQLGQAKIVDHQLPRLPACESRRGAPSSPRRCSPGERAPSPFTETPDQMVRRVCRELGNKQDIVVINDEAHHCYRRQPAEEDEERGSSRRRAPRGREARGGGAGLDLAAWRRSSARSASSAVYDLSATPFFLRGLRLPRGHPVPVGGLRLLADRRDRVRHRQGAARAGVRRLDDRATCRPTATCGCTIRDELPRKGRRHRGGRRASPSCPTSWRARCTASTATTRSTSSSGTTSAEAREREPRRRCSSWSATTPTSPSSSSTTSPAGRRRSPMATTVIVPGQLDALQQRRRRRRLARTAQHDPGRQRAARVRRGDERRVQEDRRHARSTSSRTSTARASPGATPRS